VYRTNVDATGDTPTWQIPPPRWCSLEKVGNVTHHPGPPARTYKAHATAKDGSLGHGMHSTAEVEAEAGAGAGTGTRAAAAAAAAATAAAAPTAAAATRATRHAGGAPKIRSRNHKCESCARGFHTRLALRNHLSVHDTVKPFRCHCGEAFSTDWRLRTHTYNVHCTERRFHCETCAKAFKTSSHLKSHRRIHAVTATTAATVSATRCTAGSS